MNLKIFKQCEPVIIGCRKNKKRVKLRTRGFINRRHEKQKSSIFNIISCIFLFVYSCIFEPIYSVQTVILHVLSNYYFQTIFSCILSFPKKCIIYCIQYGLLYVVRMKQLIMNIYVLYCLIISNAFLFLYSCIFESIYFPELLFLHILSIQEKYIIHCFQYGLLYIVRLKQLKINKFLLYTINYNILCILKCIKYINITKLRIALFNLSFNVLIRQCLDCVYQCLCNKRPYNNVYLLFRMVKFFLYKYYFIVISQIFKIPVYNYLILILSLNICPVIIDLLSFISFILLVPEILLLRSLIRFIFYKDLILLQLYIVCKQIISIFDKMNNKFNQLNKIMIKNCNKIKKFIVYRYLMWYYRFILSIVMCFEVMRIISCILYIIVEWIGLLIVIIFEIVQYLSYQCLYVDPLKYGIYHLRIEIPVLNINTYFAYSKRTVLRDLQSYLSDIFITNDHNPEFTIFVNNCEYDLNDNNNFDMLLTKFDIFPESVVVVPRINNVFKDESDQFVRVSRQEFTKSDMFFKPNRNQSKISKLNQLKRMKHLSITIKVLNVRVLFQYNSETLLQHLHEFIINIFESNGEIPHYRIVQNLYVDSLNNTKKFGVQLTEFNIPSMSIIVVPRSCYEPICGAGPFKKKKNKRGLKRKFSDITQADDAKKQKQQERQKKRRVQYSDEQRKRNNVLDKNRMKDARNELTDEQRKQNNVLDKNRMKDARKKLTTKAKKKNKILRNKKNKNKRKKLTTKEKEEIKILRNKKNKEKLIQKKKKDLEKTHKSFFVEDNFDEGEYIKNNPLHYSGSINGKDHECKHCKARMFIEEQLSNTIGQYSLCCGNGNISLPKLPTLPDKLREYLIEESAEARYFRKHIRQINAALAFASMGCNNKTLPQGSFKIQGQVCHRIGETFTKSAKFASIFFYDTDNELENRMEFGYMPNTKIGKKVIKNLQKIIHEINPFYKTFKTAIDRQMNEKIPALQIVLKAEMKPQDQHKGCYNKPTGCGKGSKISQIAAIIPGYGLDHTDRDIVLYCKDKTDGKDYVTNADGEYIKDKNGKKIRKIVKIDQRHQHYDPTQYVTMFPWGTYGWSPDKYFTTKGYNHYLANNKDSFDDEIHSICSDREEKDNDIIDLNNDVIQECHCNSNNRCKCFNENDLDTPDIEENDSNIANAALIEALDKTLNSESKESEDNECVEGESENVSSKKTVKEKATNQSKQKRQGTHYVKCRKYYKYRCMIRNERFNYLQRYGKLWQQYIVDGWAKCDDNDLNFIRDKQKTIRRAHADGLEAAMERDKVGDAGIPTILPRTHIGSPRWYHDKFQDAMSIIQTFKKPDLFITFTCNPKWREITENLFESQSAYDRPALVARVFNLKKKELIKDLITREVFGKVIGNVQVVEFQKRGLPHIHILLILSKRDSMKNCDQYDKIVSAEIPNIQTNPILYKRVMSHMIHFHTKQCWTDNTCSKFFPKDYAAETTTQDDGYPIYKRRSPENGGCKVIIKKKKKKHTVTNAYVVPYNPKLLLKYDCHINVEICSTIRSVKYLYKYVYKGSDRTMIKVTKTGKSNKEAKKPRNEIKQYVDCRFISAIEAAYRLLEFRMHDRYPSVLPLMVHLPNKQFVTFDTDDTIDQLNRKVKRSKKTTLQAWFDNNKKEKAKPLSNDKLGYDCEGNLKPRGPELLYHEYPKYYAYKNNKFTRRTKEDEWQIGRLHTAHPSEGQRWYLRILLNQVCGATGYLDLLTYKSDDAETKIYNCFKKRCIAEGLLEDDKEWDKALSEASALQTGSQLRRLFAMLLKECHPQDAPTLFNRYKNFMIEDIEYQYKLSYKQDQYKRRSNKPYEIPESIISKMHNTALYEICDILEQYNIDYFKLYDLIKPEKNDCFVFECKEIMNERKYNKIDCENEYLSKYNDMNEQQKVVCDKLIKSIYDNENNSESKDNLFFIDAPGGTGKTFVCNAILSYVRSKGHIALPCASSGIAATNFKGGRTVHSRFMVPIQMYHTSTCTLTRNSAKFKLIQEAKVIIWDEAPMQQRWIMECVDRSLRSLLGVEKPFGGKTIIFSGDFRQVSCVIPRAGKAQIIERTFTNSYLWQSIKCLYLFENERIKRMNGITEHEKSRLESFGEFLLQIGEGRYPNKEESIQLPRNMVSTSLTIDNFVNEIYGDLQNINQDISEENIDLNGLKTAILTPKNEHVRQINKIAIKKFKGKVREYKSINRVAENSLVCTYTTEYLNSLEINGLPEHMLSLKVGVPIMVLRNIDPFNGVCNGTKGIVSKLGTYIIEVIINDINIGPKTVFLHRISIEPSDPKIGIKFKRRQFPIHLAFAMTINKSQGQTLHKVGLYLAEPVFGHGQLYVALSRVIHPDSLKICVAETKTQGKLKENSSTVYTQNIVFREILISAGIIKEDFVENSVDSNLHDDPLVFEYEDSEFDSKSEDEWIDDITEQNSKNNTTYFNDDNDSFYF